MNLIDKIESAEKDAEIIINTAKVEAQKIKDRAQKESQESLDVYIHNLQKEYDVKYQYEISVIKKRTEELISNQNKKNLILEDKALKENQEAIRMTIEALTIE